MWTGLVWLEIGKSGMKILGNCRVAAQLVGSQVALSSIELDVRTSQETHLCTSAAFTGIALLFYM
jgi:hypothetical protein